MIDPNDYVIDCDCTVFAKAVPDLGGRRLIHVEASNQNTDSEGDSILQSALLSHKDDFLQKGVIDYNHLSEIGYRIPYLPKPMSHYIVGKPLSVSDLGNGRTGVTLELNKGPEANKIWDDLQNKPEIKWRASVFGQSEPAERHDVRLLGKSQLCPSATRFVVFGFKWKSLALTTKPQNKTLLGNATIIHAKSFIDDIIGKGADQPVIYDYELQPPRNRVELLSHNAFHCEKGHCPATTAIGRSVAGFRDHFVKCCGLEYGEADIYALALMQLLKRY